MKHMVHYVTCTATNSAWCCVKPDWRTFSINDCRDAFKRKINKHRNLNVFKERNFCLRFTFVEASKHGVAREIVEASLRTLGYKVVREHFLLD